MGHNELGDFFYSRGDLQARSRVLFTLFWLSLFLLARRAAGTAAVQGVRVARPAARCAASCGCLTARCSGAGRRAAAAGRRGCCMASLPA